MATPMIREATGEKLLMRGPFAFPGINTAVLHKSSSISLDSQDLLAGTVKPPFVPRFVPLRVRLRDSAAGGLLCLAGVEERERKKEM